jgi:hypothetical protein
MAAAGAAAAARLDVDALALEIFLACGEIFNVDSALRSDWSAAE